MGLDPATLAGLAAAAGIGIGKGIEAGIRYGIDRYRRRNGNGKSIQEQQLEALKSIHKRLGGIYGRLGELDNSVDEVRNEARDAHKEVADAITNVRIELASLGAVHPKGDPA